MCDLVFKSFANGKLKQNFASQQQAIQKQAEIVYTGILHHHNTLF